MIRLRSILTLLLLFFIQSTLFAVSDYNVFFKNQTFVPIENHGVVDELSIQKNTFEGKIFALVQFYEIPSNEQIALLQSHQITIGFYFKRNAYSVVFPADKYYLLKNNPKVRSLFFQLPNLKISQNLTNIANVQEERKTVSVMFHKGTDLEMATKKLKSEIVGVIFTGLKMGVLEINLNHFQLNQLANYPFVHWIEESKKEFVALDYPAVNQHRVNIVTSTLPGRRGLSGEGVAVGTWDLSGVGSHIDFAGRVTNIEAFTGGVAGQHSTNVSGVLAGAGNLNPFGIGMAPNADIFAWDVFGNLIMEMDTGTIFHNLKIINHSYAFSIDVCGTRGSYTIASYFYDTLTLVHPDLLMVYAAGNSRGDACIAGGYRTILSDIQSSKNGLSVGNLTSTDGNSTDHSYGPTLDGRLKPDLCAMGVSIFTPGHSNIYNTVGATSFSAPGVSGTAALLYEHYRNLNAGADPASHTIKAILMNTARDLGRPGPDYQFGFGRIDAEKSAIVMENNQYVVGNIVLGDSLVDTLTIGGASNTEEIRFMLAWTDAASSAASATALINDLDFLVIDPNGDTILPLVLDHTNPTANATEKIDTLNVNEQIIVNDVIPGDYKFVVLGTTIPSGSTNFTVTWLETEPNITLTYPIGGEKWAPPSNAATRQIIAWDGFDIRGTITVEFSADSGATWTTLASGLDSTTRYFSWSTASSALYTTQAFIRVSSTVGGLTSMNDTMFTIMPNPQNAGPNGIVCTEQVRLFWNPLSPSEEFKVYQLIGEDMVEIAQTSDTFLLVDGLTNGETHWFAISGVDSNGFESRRSLATSHLIDGTNFPPSITLQPTDQNVCLNGDVLFESSVSANPAATSQWQISSDGGNTWNNISGETTNSLELMGLDSSIMAFSYRNVYTNSCGGEYPTDTVSIIVDSIPPSPSILTTAQTACSDTVEFNSSITDPILQYDWTFEDAENPTESGVAAFGPIVNQWVWPTNAGSKEIILTVSYPSNSCSNADTISLNVGCIALPIELLNFQATPFTNYVLLDWETVNELNNDYFTILKSTDLLSWKEIGIVQGAGNSFENNSYQFIDNSPIKGIQYYRLKQTDYDGKSSISKTVEVIFNNQISTIQIRPNPVEDLLYIESPEQISRVCIKSISGKTIFETKSFSQSISLTTLPSGIYFIEVETENRIEVMKIIKQ